MVRSATRRPVAARGSSLRWAGLEPLLQVLLVPRHLLPRLAAHERNEQLANAMTLEIELHRHSRARTVLERLDRALPNRPDRAINAAEPEPARGVVVRHLHRHRALPPAEPADMWNARPDADRAVPCMRA